MRHLIRCLISAARRPKVAILGMREFRLNATLHFDYPEIESYDSGRELAHLFTFRHFDN